MKTLEFIYQETEIHFLVNPSNKNVMVNATEMAKMFGKRTDNYLQIGATKTFIKAIERTIYNVQLENKVPDMSGTLDIKIVENKGRNGIYFCELLAIDFATWLDVDFKVWVYQRIQEVLFGNYKSHWDAHQEQVSAEQEMESLEAELRNGGDPSKIKDYFQARDRAYNAKKNKRRAIANQYKIDFN